MPTVGMWNSLTTVVSSALDGSGYLKAIPSPVSISVMQIGTRLEVSSASITGIPMSPVFVGSGVYSGPTTCIGGLLISPRPVTLRWVAALTRFVVSTASVGFDLRVRGASIFANATTRPSIAAGGTYVSTASIATVNINVGDLLQADVATVGIDGFVSQITIQAGTQ